MSSNTLFLFVNFRCLECSLDKQFQTDSVQLLFERIQFHILCYIVWKSLISNNSQDR